MFEVSERSAVVLLSGGLDSATVLAMARADSLSVHALSFRYGQRHEHELRSATRLAERFAVAEHVVVNLNLDVFGGSALTDEALAVPHDRDEAALGAGIPITYVPARNTIFLSYALAFAEVRAVEEIHLGVNALDYSGYPDCRPEYIAAFQEMARLATRQGVEGVGVRIVTPLIELTKAEIIAAGTALGVDYAMTHSCYDPDALGRPCGTCDACQLRLRGFAEAGMSDPAEYQPC